MVPQTTAKFWL